MSPRTTWRRFERRDTERVVLLHTEMEDAIGRRMQLPDLMDRPVLEAWVAERDGVVIGGFYVEAVAEPVFFGRDPRISVAAHGIAPLILGGLQAKGLKMVRMEVPRWIGNDGERISRALELAGFVESDSEFRHYRYDLTTQQAAPERQTGPGDV
jgi:hypothetical protein